MNEKSESSKPGHTSSKHARPDSDDDDLADRDYDVAALANNLSQAFRYKIYGNEDAEEVFSQFLDFCSYSVSLCFWV